MSIQANVENLLILLNYPVNESTKNQLDGIVDNTNSFYDFANHIFNLEDELKKVDATIAMSNSKPYLKLKCNSKKDIVIEDFKTLIESWSDKYKVEIEKVENKNTYYIIGKNS